MRQFLIERIDNWIDAAIIGYCVYTRDWTCLAICVTLTIGQYVRTLSATQRQ